MALEIARRLAQDGVTWETVVVDEDTGGGSQPFTGWAGDGSDPANVDSNGGALTVGGLTALGFVDVSAGGLTMGSAGIVQDDGTKTQTLSASGGVAQDDGSGLTTNLAPAVLDLEGDTAFATVDGSFGRLSARPATGAVAITVSGTNTPAGVIDPNGVALLIADQRVVLDPLICTPADIANALIALGIAKAS